MSNNNDNSVNILKEERNRLLERVSIIEGLIELIEGKTKASKIKEPVIDKSSDLEYDSGKSLKFKVLHIIKTKNRFLHSSEIRLEIARLDGANYKSGNISAVLSILKRTGKIHKVQIGKQNRDTFWGSKKWLDADENILEKYLYDKSLLSEKAAGDEIEL